MRIVLINLFIITSLLFSLKSLGSSNCMKNILNTLVNRHERTKTIGNVSVKIKKLMAKLTMYDKNISEHSFAVAQIASRMGKRMGFSGADQAELVFSGLIHDIGKLEVHLDILTSSTNLTNKEFTILKNHVGKFLDQRITKLIEKTDNFAEKKIWDHLKTIASQHHEKYNSKGYLQGLRGDEIEQTSQIISLADTWNALRSKRSYKKPFGLKKTFAIISDGFSRGKFNPSLQQKFKKMIIKYEHENLEKLKLKLLKMKNDPKFIANDEYKYLENMLKEDLKYLADLK